MTRLESKRVAYSRELRKLLVGFADYVSPVDRIVGLNKIKAMLPDIRKEFKLSYSVLLDSLLEKQALLAFRDIKRLGLKVPDRNEWLDSFLKKFKSTPFKGRNLNNRISVSASMFVKSVDVASKIRVPSDGPEILNMNLVKVLSGKSSGLSAYHWSDRLMMGEAKRAYWDAYVDLSVKNDAVVEWVMNPSCKHCPTCLSYAKESDPSLTGINDGPKPGVYLASRFPKSPHPWCGCMPKIVLSGVDR